MLNHQIDPQKVEWAKIQKDKLNGILIELSFGLERSINARQTIALANKYNLTWHGYHTFTSQINEIKFAIEDAINLGLQAKQCLFLMVNTNVSDVVANSYTFISTCQSDGFKPGICCQASYYQDKFNDNDLAATQVLRWLISDSEPANYDLWEYETTNDYGADSLPSVFDKNNQLSSNLSITNYDVTSNAYVGFGSDTTGLGGGISLGYSTDGYNFVSAITPFGFIFREVDAARMWKLLRSKVTTIVFNSVKLKSPSGKLYTLTVDDDGKLQTSLYQGGM